MSCSPPSSVCRLGYLFAGGLIFPFIVPCKLNPLWCGPELLLTFPFYGGVRGQVGEISIKDEGREGIFRPPQCFFRKEPLGVSERTN